MNLEATLRMVNGTGLLSRRRDSVLFMPDPQDSDIVQRFAETEGDVIASLGDHLTDRAMTAPDFVCVAWADQLTVMCFGELSVTTDNPSLPMLSGAGSATWVERTVRRVDGSVTIEVDADDCGQSTDLQAGQVLAGGFSLLLAVASEQHSPEEQRIVDRSGGEIVSDTYAESELATSEITNPAAAVAAIRAALSPNPEPAASAVAPETGTLDEEMTLPPPQPDLEVATDGVVGERPLVEAKKCSHGHINEPLTASCIECGELLTPGMDALVNVPRPSLGSIVFDDGSQLDLDDELLMGRSPASDTDPDRQHLRRLKISGDKVSRVHLEVRFQGWDVQVADCGSSNGTYVIQEGAGVPDQLAPGVRYLLETGTTVYFGSRSFTFHPRGRR